MRVAISLGRKDNLWRTASGAKDSYMPPELDEIRSKPLLIRFNGDDQPAIMDPFAAAGLREATLGLEMLRGKQCLAYLQGEWLLMFDGSTHECFMVSLASLSRISLPPLFARWSISGHRHGHSSIGHLICLGEGLKHW